MMKMNPLTRRTLCEIITNYGRSLCDNPQRCEGLLRDFCGQYRAEIFVLVTALKEGVAEELLKSSQTTVPQEIVLTRLSKRLQKLGMAKKSACWAVNSWALALGMSCQLEESEEEAEFEEQELIKDEEYKSKLRQYEQEFSTAVKSEYPLTVEVRNKLREVQQSLGIKLVDVGKIEKPILSEKEVKYWKQSAAKQQEKFQELEESFELQKNRQKALEKKAKNLKSSWVTTIIISALTVISLGYLYDSQYQENNSLHLRFDRLSDKNRSLSSQLDSFKSENQSLFKELHTLRNVRDNVNNLLTRSSSTGSTYLRLCNKTSSKISAAWAYWDGNGWRSRGWWNREAGECKAVYVGYNYRGKVYIYGKFSGGSLLPDNQWSSGDSLFCAERHSAFNISNSDKPDNCSGSGRKMVKMSEFTVFPGTNTWNFNATNLRRDSQRLDFLDLINRNRN